MMRATVCRYFCPLPSASPAVGCLDLTAKRPGLIRMTGNGHFNRYKLLGGVDISGICKRPSARTSSHKEAETAWIDPSSYDTAPRSVKTCWTDNVQVPRNRPHQVLRCIPIRPYIPDSRPSVNPFSLGHTEPLGDRSLLL